MSSGYIECGNCKHGFDCTYWKDGKVEVKNPIQCPACGSIASELNNKYERTWTKMDKETSKAIAQAAIPQAPMRDWEVEIMIGKKVCASVTVRARDKDKAKERAFVQLDFNVKKAYAK